MRVGIKRMSWNRKKNYIIFDSSIEYKVNLFVFVFINNDKIK
jgi:hypothetical protein